MKLFKDQLQYRYDPVRQHFINRQVFIFNFNVSDGYDVNSKNFTVTINNTQPEVNFTIPNLYAKFEFNFETLIPMYHFMDNDTEMDTSFEFSAKLKNTGGSLPEWMVFSKKTRTFYGLCPLQEFLTCASNNGNPLIAASAISIPAAEEKLKSQPLKDKMVEGGIPVTYRECYYDVRITAFDQHANISCDFTLIIYDHAPVQMSTLVNAEQHINIHSNKKLEFYISSDIFGDIDIEDKMAYYIEVVNRSALPDWYSLNKDIRLVTFFGDPAILSGSGCPGQIQNLQNSKGGGIFANYSKCDFFIRVIVGDTVFNATVQLSVTVFNEGPYYNKPIYSINNSPASYVLSVTKGIDYIFPLDAFHDSDDDMKKIIQFSIRNVSDTEPLPSWLQFFAKFRRFMGKPSTSTYFNGCKRNATNITGLAVDIGNSPVTVVQEYCLLDIMVVASDGVFEAQQIFQIYIYNNVPYNYQSLLSEVDDPEEQIYIQSNNTIRTHVGLLFEFNIPLKIFKETDENQNMFHNVYIFVGGVKQELNDAWVTYDASALRVYGTPMSKHLLECEAANFFSRPLNVSNKFGDNVTITEQYCDVYMQLGVTDSFLLSELTIDFVIQVYNYFPFIYYPIENQSDYITNFRYFHYNEYIFFQLHPQTIQDLDATDVLKIQFSHAYTGQQLSWLKFDTSFNYFFGQPEPCDLYEICPSKFENDSTKFTHLSVQDEDYPTAKSIAVRQYYCNYTFTLTVLDPYSNITQSVNFSIYNTNPYPNTPLYVLGKQVVPMRLHISTTFELNFPMNTLLDDDQLDKIFIKYELTSIVEGGSVEQELPEWIKFNFKNLRIAGQAPDLKFLDNCPASDRVEITHMDKVRDWIGRPVPLQEVGCRVILKLTMFDRREIATQQMQIIIQNYRPYQYCPIYLHNNASAAWRVHVTATSEHIMSRETFKDFDLDKVTIRLIDSLTNSSQKVPNWLRYEAKLRRLIASPPKLTIGLYNVSFEVSDGYQQIISAVEIEVYNNGPMFIGTQIPFYLTIDQQVKIKFPTSSLRFVDLDNDDMVVEFFCLKDAQNVALDTCNDYLRFDQKRLTFTANPQKSSGIPFFPERLAYYQETVVLIKITDTNDNSNTTTFSVIVEHVVPRLNPRVPSIQYQYSALANSQQISPKPGCLIEFPFAKDSFLFEPNTRITYTAKVRLVTPYASPVALGELEYLLGEWRPINMFTGFWLKFDGTNRKFYGVPETTDVGHFQVLVNVSDALGFAQQMFFVNISNAAPKVIGKLANYSFVFNRRSIYITVDSLVFSDADDAQSVLTFSAFAQYHINATDKNIRRALNPYFSGFWLKYDPIRNIIFGTPSKGNIEYNATEKRYYQQYQI